MSYLMKFYEKTVEGVSTGTEKEISELTARLYSNEHEEIITKLQKCRTEFQTSLAKFLI